MTNEQYQIQLKMIIELIKSSETKEEAVKKNRSSTKRLGESFQNKNNTQEVLAPLV